MGVMLGVGYVTVVASVLVGRATTFWTGFVLGVVLVVVWCFAWVTK